MKKTLLATAIAASLAASGAQAATVYNQDGTKLDIYGNIQIAYYSINDENGDALDEIADNGSTFGFAAEHVINDGLTGYLKLEFDDFDATEIATEGRGAGDTAYVGLKGNFGDVRVGSYDQLIDDWIQDPITNNEGFDVSDSTTAHGMGGEQQEDKVTYTSPSFSGLQFAIGTQYRGDGEFSSTTVDTVEVADGVVDINEEVVLTGEDMDGSSDASMFGGVKYTAGAFSIAAVYDNLETLEMMNSDGSVDSVGDAYGITAQYTVDTLRLSAKVERFESDIEDGDDTNFYALGARYGYGNGDIYAAYQYIDVGAGTFLSELDEQVQGEQDRSETYNEVILGANYSISDAMYVWSEVAMRDRAEDEGDGVGVGVTYLF